MHLFHSHKVNSTFFALLPLAVVFGVAAGFAVPLVASYQTNSVLEGSSVPGPRQMLGETPGPSTSDLAHDSELAKLVDRNRRLEGLVANLRQKNVELADKLVISERSNQY